MHIIHFTIGDDFFYACALLDTSLLLFLLLLCCYSACFLDTLLLLRFKIPLLVCSVLAIRFLFCTP